MMYGRESVFSRAGDQSRIGGMTQYNYDPKSNAQGVGSYRLDYRIDQISTPLTNAVPQWKDLNPMSICAREGTLHLSLPELRVEDYFNIRNNKLKPAHDRALKDAINTGAFNQQLLSTAPPMLPFFAEQAPDLDSLRSANRNFSDTNRAYSGITGYNNTGATGYNSASGYNTRANLVGGSTGPNIFNPASSTNTFMRNTANMFNKSDNMFGGNMGGTGITNGVSGINNSTNNSGGNGMVRSQSIFGNNLIGPGNHLPNPGNNSMGMGSNAMQASKNIFNNGGSTVFNNNGSNNIFAQNKSSSNIFGNQGQQGQGGNNLFKNNGNIFGGNGGNLSGNNIFAQNGQSSGNNLFAQNTNYLPQIRNSFDDLQNYSRLESLLLEQQKIFQSLLSPSQSSSKMEWVEQPSKYNYQLFDATSCVRRQQPPVVNHVVIINKGDAKMKESLSHSQILLAESQVDSYSPPQQLIYSLDLIWTDDPDRTQKLEGSLCPDGEDHVKTIRQHLIRKKLIKKNAEVEITNKERKGDSELLEGRVTTRIFNLPPGYYSFTSGLERGKAFGLRIGNQFGDIRWQHPVDTDGLDLSEGLVISPNTVGCDIDALNSECFVSFYSIPSALLKYKDDVESAKRKISRQILKKSAVCELIDMKFNPPSWTLKFQRFQPSHE